MTPVMFSYGGWQTSSFVAGEMRNPSATSRAGCCSALSAWSCSTAPSPSSASMRSGRQGLAASKTPASDVMRLALGEQARPSSRFGIAISALGFLSQGMLTAPRVYFAMAEDGLFFRRVAEVSAKTRVPVVAIVLQGAAAAVIALSGTYGQILSYVVSVDFIFFGLTGAALFVFRRRDPEQRSRSTRRSTR